MLKKVLMFGAVVLVGFALMMATTGQAEFTQEDDILLSVSPQKVWAVLAAVEQWDQWWPGFESARVTPALQTGARLDLSLKGDPGYKPAVVETVVPARKLSWVRDGVLGSTTHTRLQLEAVSDDTLFVMRSTIRGPQAFLARLTAQDQFSEYHQAVLKSLQIRLEQQRAVAAKPATDA